MLIPASRLLQSMVVEFERLCEQLPDSFGDGSSKQSLGNAFNMLLGRQQQGEAAVRGQFVNLLHLLNRLDELVGKAGFKRTRQQIDKAQAVAGLELLEADWEETMRYFEREVQALLQDGAMAVELKQSLRQQLVEFETADLFSQRGDTLQTTDEETSIAITREKMQVYLRDRFAEPTLTVPSLQPLSGGFGKETYMFAVEGQALSGDFVMRRDIGSNSGLENDCHLIGMEYPVIRAVAATGFSAPEALWLDTEHPLLPGGHFIIMRRSPGSILGNFAGAQTDVPAGLVKTLADNMARLHLLEPLEPLFSLNESINSDFWAMDRQQSIREYIQGWYQFWLDEVHSASPSLVALYDWLLSHVPQRSGKPSLLHGDIGFHNFLSHNGDMSVLLDWEFAHVGDPAEELAYVKVTAGEAIDWQQFVNDYQAAGGDPVDDATLHYFMVWAYVRNASAANIISNRFITGRADDLKLTFLPFNHVPVYLQKASELIDHYPD